MTFDALEYSQQDSQPAELYQFRLAAEQFNYTTAEGGVTWQAVAYSPVILQRARISISREVRKSELGVQMPASDPLAQRFRTYPPDGTMTLTVLRIQIADGVEETRLLFKGRVVGAAFSDNGEIATLRVRSLESGLTRGVPRFVYSGLCNHVLYDANCKVDRELFKFTGNVIAETGSDITVQNVSTQGADWAVAGYVQIGAAVIDGIRFVRQQSGDTLTLLLPFENSVLGSPVTVYSGCAHDVATCRDKFANVVNFGGFPYVPGINPFTDGLDV